MFYVCPDWNNSITKPVDSHELIHYSHRFSPSPVWRAVLKLNADCCDLTTLPIFDTANNSQTIQIWQEEESMLSWDFCARRLVASIRSPNCHSEQPTLNYAKLKALMKFKWVSYIRIHPCAVAMKEEIGCRGQTKLWTCYISAVGRGGSLWGNDSLLESATSGHLRNCGWFKGNIMPCFHKLK